MKGCGRIWCKMTPVFSLESLRTWKPSNWIAHLSDKSWRTSWI